MCGLIISDYIELTTFSLHIWSRIWGQKVSALDCGDEVAKWLSQEILYQDSGARLVYYPHSHAARQVATKLTLPWLRETDGVNIHIF